MAIQDVRGRGDSDGKFDFFFQEGQDGHDTIEWMAAQPWSNGDVCTAGVSYLGTDQWLAAREHPSALKCMVATASAGLSRLGRVCFWIPTSHQTTRNDRPSGQKPENAKNWPGWNVAESGLLSQTFLTST